MGALKQEAGDWRLEESKPQASNLEPMSSPLRLWRLGTMDLDATWTITSFTRRRQNSADAA